MATLGGCVACYVSRREKGKTRVGWKEEGTRASDLSEEEGCDPILDLASQPCMLFTVWWHVAANEQKLAISATSLESAWI